MRTETIQNNFENMSISHDSQRKVTDENIKRKKSYLNVLNNDEDDCDLDFAALNREIFTYDFVCNNNVCDKDYSGDILSGDLKNNRELKENAKKTKLTNKEIKQKDKFKFNIKDIINQKDNNLISKVERRLKNLNILKENDTVSTLNNTIKTEKSLYDICNQNKINPNSENNFYTPGKRNKFDDVILSNSRINKNSNFISRLNINAEEFVPKKLKGLEPDLQFNLNEPYMMVNDFKNSNSNHNNINDLYKDCRLNEYTLGNINQYRDIFKKDYFN